jgi:hypothetical protein
MILFLFLCVRACVRVWCVVCVVCVCGVCMCVWCVCGVCGVCVVCVCVCVSQWDVTVKNIDIMLFVKQ